MTHCKRLTFAICFLLIVTGQSEVFGGDANDTYSEAEKIAKHSAYVTYASVGVPLGYLLLIRKENDMCAIRFTEYHRGRDARPPTVTNTGEETLYAEYDWYYKSSKNAKFIDDDQNSGHAKLERKQLTGIGRFSFQSGNTIVRCGPFKLQWYYPNGVGFHSKPTPSEEGIEIAPTRWRNIEDIKLTDAKLKWYRYDKEEKRPAMHLPVEGK